MPLTRSRAVRLRMVYYVGARAESLSLMCHGPHATTLQTGGSAVNRHSNTCFLGDAARLRQIRSDVREPRPTKKVATPKKMPARLSPCGRSARPTLSLLAVTLLHGYVMSPVLV